MYYEYHLENGITINSEKPYVNGFYLSYGEQNYCPDLDEWYEIDSFVRVSYCLVKQGKLTNNIETDDHWIENVELGD